MTDVNTKGETMKKITVDQVIKWKPCGYDGPDNGKNYTESKVKKLFGRRKHMSVLRVLNLKIPSEDRLWAVLRPELIDEKTLRLFACDCAERILKAEQKAERKTDIRSWKAIEVSRLFVYGEATKKELDAARDAAGAAAWAAAGAAARDAAWAAEHKWQIKHLKEMLSRREKP